MPYLLDTYVEMKVPTASVQHGAEKGFCYKRFIHKLWHHLLTCDILRGYYSNILHTFSMTEPSKGPKKANDTVNATWNTT